jgi:hypothetical protein
MENGPFIDDFPINTSIYKGFSMAMLNNQMVTGKYRERRQIPRQPSHICDLLCPYCTQKLDLSRDFFYVVRDVLFSAGFPIVGYMYPAIN